MYNLRGCVDLSYAWYLATSSLDIDILMPRKRKAGKKKKGGKSKSKKGRPGGGKTSALGGKKMTKTVVPGSGFQSDVEIVKMRYTDELLFTFGASGGAVANLEYGVNTPLVPCRTAGTETSQGWASQAAKYGKYVCTGSRIRWRITKLSAGGMYGSLGTMGVIATNSSLVHAVVYPVTSRGAPATSIRNAAVQKYASRRFEWPYGNTTTSAESTQDQNNPRMTWRGSMAMSPSKLDGEPNLRSASYEANTNAEPSLICLYVIAFQDILLDTTYEGVFSVEIDIEYDVTFFDRLEFDNVLVQRPPLRTVRAPPISSSEKKEPSLVLDEKKSSIPPIENLLIEDYRLAPPRAGIQGKERLESKGQSKPIAGGFFRGVGFL